MEYEASILPSPRLMGECVNPTWLKVLAITVATIIVGLNGWLLFQTFLGWLNR